MICGACGELFLDSVAEVRLQCRLGRMGIDCPAELPGSDHWETCELAVRQKGGRTPFGAEYQFWAQALGPQGEYNAGEAVKWRQRGYLSVEQSEPAVEARAKLIHHLIEDGWEPVAVGPYWWQTTFRRRVRECGQELATLSYRP